MYNFLFSPARAFEKGGGGGGLTRIFSKFSIEVDFKGQASSGNHIVQIGQNLVGFKLT